MSCAPCLRFARVPCAPRSGSRAAPRHRTGHLVRSSSDPLDGFDLFGDAFGPPTSKPKKEKKNGTPRTGRGKGTTHETSTRGNARHTQRKRAPNTTKPTQQTRRRSVDEMMRSVNYDSGEKNSGEKSHSRRVCVVVEGANDAKAVHRTMNNAPHDTILLKGTYDNKSGHHVVPADVILNLTKLADADVPIIILTDCDVAGRQLRSRVVLSVPVAKHAFLGTQNSSASQATKWHALGNVGVEHASEESIQNALNNARAPYSDGGSSGVSRNQFTRELLQTNGLCGPLGSLKPDAKWQKLGGVATRRRLVGEYLGVGDCDAKQLVRQLNLFFEMDEFQDAIDHLPKEGEEIPQKMTDGGSARIASGGVNTDVNELDIWAYVPPGEAPPGFE